MSPNSVIASSLRLRVLDVEVSQDRRQRDRIRQVADSCWIIHGMERGRRAIPAFTGSDTLLEAL
jgi:hypothetical protein